MAGAPFFREALGFRFIANPIKLETGLRPNSAGIPYTLLLRIEAIGFPTFRLLLYGAVGLWGFRADGVNYVALGFLFQGLGV